MQAVGEIQVAVGIVGGPTASPATVASTTSTAASTVAWPIAAIASAVSRGVFDAHEREDIMGEFGIRFPVGHAGTRIAAPVIISLGEHQRPADRQDDQ